MDRAPDDGTIRVTFAFSPEPRRVEGCELRLPAGSNAADAVAAGAQALRQTFDTTAGRLAIGIWGRPCEPDQALRDGDRVEVYRPLLADPKDTRRRRQQLQQRATPRRGRGSR